MNHNPNYSEETGYVNIHGKDVKVYVCEKTGRILIPIDELKVMGFRIYRKSQYSRLLIDENQFNKEFSLFMLQAAQTYMLENKIAFNKNDILDCINKCKSTLTGQSTQGTSYMNSFAKNHTIQATSDDDIKITTQLRQPLSKSPQNLTNGRGFQKREVSPASDNSKDGDFRRKSGFNRNFRERNGVETKFQNSRQSNDFGESSFKENRGPRQNFGDSKPNFQENKRDFVARQSFGDSKPNFQEKQDNFQKSNESLNESEKIETVKFNKQEHEVVVSFVEKLNCAWVQDLERADILVEIDSKVKKEVANQEKKHMRYSLNKIYLAADDGMWCRCKVIKFKPMTVFFVDYGNTAQTTDIREASKELSKIPAQAVRITFPESQGKVEANEAITIQIKKMYDNGTYSVDILKTNSLATPPVETHQSPPTLFTKPRPLCALQSGQRVMVISHSNGKLALRTKECYDKLKQVEMALERESSATPVDTVKVGQLVAVKTDKLKRGVVLNVLREELEVELLDYYDKVSVYTSKVRHISESLAKEAVTFIITPIVKNYSGDDTVLQALIDNRSKATVVLEGGSFDLNLGSDFLSDRLKTGENRPMITDFKQYKPKLGSGEYILNTYVDKNELYFAETETMQDHLDVVIKLTVEDSEPYQPIKNEVCLGFYQDNWCRCAVLDITGPKFKVSFIDFGNIEELKSCDMRKLPEDATSAPVLVFRCFLTGLPNMIDIDEELKALFIDGESYEIDIKKLVGDKYEIQIPKLFED